MQESRPAYQNPARPPCEGTDVSCFSARAAAEELPRNTFLCHFLVTYLLSCAFITTRFLFTRQVRRSSRSAGKWIRMLWFRGAWTINTSGELLPESMKTKRQARKNKDKQQEWELKYEIQLYRGVCTFFSFSPIYEGVKKSFSEETVLFFKEYHSSSVRMDLALVFKKSHNTALQL